MADLNKAKKRMDKVLLEWHLQDPLLLHTWCLVDKIPDKKQTTIGIDSRSYPPRVKYNPNFVNSLNKEQLESVMTSECLKLLLKHPTTRLQKPQNIAALSSSIVVDQMIMSSIKGLDFGPAPMPKMFELPEDSYFEDYFRKLNERQDEVNEQIQEMWNELSEEEKLENIQKAIENQNQEDKKQKQNIDGDGYQQVSDALKEYHNPNGSVTQDWGSNELLDSDLKNMLDKLKGSGRMWGKYTSSHMGDILAAHVPKIDAREILRRFNNSVLSGSSVTSRMKLNRRYGLDQAGYRRQYKSKIIFAIDQSCSMTDEDLAEGFSIVNSACKHSKIEYVLWDTQINTIVKDVKKAKKTFQRTASGGTNVSEVLEYADKQKCDGLIVFSDMDFYTDLKRPKNTKVMWLGNTLEAKRPVDWGWFSTLKI